MNTNYMIDRNAIANLTAQLTELNRHLGAAEKPAALTRKFSGSTFLFGFDVNGPATSKEYRKYFEYLDRITLVLRDFGIHMNNNGYAYMLDAIKIIIDRNSFDLRLSSDIYPLIASRYHLRRNTAIEHSIRNAISSAYADYLRDPSSNSMGVFGKKPTAKKFLLYAADMVIRGMGETMMANAC